MTKIKKKTFFELNMRNFRKKPEKDCLRRKNAIGKMARATGLEPATSSVTGWYSNQLSYAPATCDAESEHDEKMARATGLEPATSSVTGWYSNQLSYAPGRMNEL